jgi:hypothetical protein
VLPGHDGSDMVADVQPLTTVMTKDFAQPLNILWIQSSRYGWMGNYLVNVNFRGTLVLQILLLSELEFGVCQQTPIYNGCHRYIAKIHTQRGGRTGILYIMRMSLLSN